MRVISLTPSHCYYYSIPRRRVGLAPQHLLPSRWSPPFTAPKTTRPTPTPTGGFRGARARARARAGDAPLVRTVHTSSKPVVGARSIEKGTKGTASSSGGAEAGKAPATTTTQPWRRHVLGPVKAFSRFQDRRPWAAQLYASVPVYVTGDLLAQYFDGQEVDALRTLRQLVIGLGAAVPGFSWFMWLNRHFNYSSHVRSLATKIFINQMTFVPIFNIYFFSLQSLLAGSSVREAYERVRNTLPTSWGNSFKLWPAVMAFSFTYIEPQSRFLFGGIFAVVWQSYLSWLNQRDVERRRRQEIGALELANS